MYPSQPKFSFIFHSQYSHDSNNRLPYGDDELLEFLQLMNERGYLDNTMFILMSDHGKQAVEFLNQLVSHYQIHCTKLHLYRIIKADQLEANERLLKSVASSDRDGCVPLFDNNTLMKKFLKHSTRNETTFYQIQFETIPGHALFELTAEYHPVDERFLILKKRLSRMNKYGQTSACIAYKRPEFREICYCSNLLNHTRTSNTVLVDTVIDNERKKLIKFHKTVANSSSLHR